MSGASLIPFVLLAKQATGISLGRIIEQVVNSPDVYVFGELWRLPNVQAVRPISVRVSWRTMVSLTIHLPR